MNEFLDDREMDDEWVKPKMEGWMDCWMIDGAVVGQINESTDGWRDCWMNDEWIVG